MQISSESSLAVSIHSNSRINHSMWPQSSSYYTSRSAHWRQTLLFIQILSIALNSNTIVIDAHHQLGGEDNFRCSHKPPAEQNRANHVWLNDASFSTGTDFIADDHAGRSNGSRPSRGAELTATAATVEGQRIKGKRHISEQKNMLLSPVADEQDAVWDRLQKLGAGVGGSRANTDELVPMRIQVHYDDSVKLLETPRQELIVDKVIPSVVNFFESVLSIRRDQTVDKFRISRRCPNNTIYYVRDPSGLSRSYCMDRCEDYAICGEMIVPPGHLSACSYCNSTSKRCLTNLASEGRGVSNAQLLLYVSAKQTSRCKKDQTIAYAAHCAQDARTDRPVAGHANLCPSSISTDPKDLRALIATVKHELTHVLGFSVSLFAYYRDEFGRPLTERDSSPGPLPVDPKTGYAKWSDKIIKKFVRTNWLTGDGKVNKEVHIMVTPTVVREVRSHFNCSTLEGAELEDQGSDGTSMTHWEKRLFENEAMTGTHTQNSVYSRLTLAVLQDTGWYVANFSRAERLDWGRELGCDFAKKSCKSWIDERRAKRMSIRPFCDRVKGDLLQIACTEDRTSKAVCNMKQFGEPLPVAYRNFDYLDGVPREMLAHYGGSVDLADYCPFIQEFTWQAQNISARGSRCDQAGGNLESERNAALEFYGPQTRCFEHGRRWEQRSCVYKRHWHHFGAGCYRYSCLDGHFNVLVGNHSYACYYPDQHVRIEQIVDHWLYNGTLVCPPCEKVCSPQKCKTFDKQLVERLLLQNSDQTSSLVLGDNNNTDSMSALFGIVDESLNSIESNLNSSDPNELKKSSDHFNYKDIWQLISQTKRPPRQALVCSGSPPRPSKLHNLPTILTLVFAAIYSATINSMSRPHSR